MSKVRAVARKLADRLYPALVRGAHYLTREKERRAFMAGFEAGWREGKVNPNPDGDAVRDDDARA